MRGIFKRERSQAALNSYQINLISIFTASRRDREWNNKTQTLLKIFPVKFFSVLKTVADGESDIAVVFELAEEGVVVFAEENVGACFDQPVVGQLV